jgi:hypothetical protein
MNPSKWIPPNLLPIYWPKPDNNPKKRQNEWWKRSKWGSKTKRQENKNPISDI